MNRIYASEGDSTHAHDMDYPTRCPRAFDSEEELKAAQAECWERSDGRANIVRCGYNHYSRLLHSHLCAMSDSEEEYTALLLELDPRATEGK